MRIGLQSKGGRKVVGVGEPRFAFWLLSPRLLAATPEAAVSSAVTPRNHDPGRRQSLRVAWKGPTDGVGPPSGPSTAHVPGQAQRATTTASTSRVPTISISPTRTGVSRRPGSTPARSSSSANTAATAGPHPAATATASATR